MAAIRTARMAVAIACLGAVVSACGGDGASPRPSSTAHVHASPTSPSLRLGNERRILRGSASIFDISVWGRYVAWAEGRPGGDPEKVVVAGPSGLRVVDTAPPHGEVDQVSGGAAELPDLIVYTVLDRVPNDAQMSSTWRLVAVDLRTGDRTTLASSTAPDPVQVIPTGFLFDHWCAWAEPDEPATPSGTEHIVAYDFLAKQRHVVAAKVRPGTVVGYDGSVIYDDTEASGARDIFTQSVTGGPRQSLTASGTAMLSTVRNAGLTWEDQTGNGASDWYRSLTQRTAPLLVGTARAANLVSGSHVVVLLSDDSSHLIASTVLPSANVRLDVPAEGDVLSISARWDMSGDTLAWASTNADGSTGAVIHLADLLS